MESVLQDLTKDHKVLEKFLRKLINRVHGLKEAKFPDKEYPKHPCYLGYPCNNCNLKQGEAEEPLICTSVCTTTSVHYE
jgi:hypothetical protein